jgi:hypothetical protein
MHLDNGYYWVKGDRQDDIIFTKVIDNIATFFVWDYFSQTSKEQVVPVDRFPPKVTVIQAFTT